MMSEEYYHKRRAELLSEFFSMKSIHCRLNAKARVRAIAKLDYEFDGTPIQQTRQLFHYNEL